MNICKYCGPLTFDCVHIREEIVLGITLGSKASVISDPLATMLLDALKDALCLIAEEFPDVDAPKNHKYDAFWPDTISKITNVINMADGKEL